jgi:hypothetical protein
MAAMLLRSRVFSDATVCHEVCSSQHSFETLGTPHSLKQCHILEDQQAHGKCAVFLRCHMPVKKVTMKCKAKQSRYRPGVAQRVPGS